MSEHKILKTEMRNPDTTNIDRMTTAEMLECIQKENENAVFSVRKALSEIEDRLMHICETKHQNICLFFNATELSQIPTPIATHTCTNV